MTTIALLEPKSPCPKPVESLSPLGVSGMVQLHPCSLMVPGVSRDIEVKIASEAAEWEAAFRLVRKNYLESGYEAPSPKLLRFTPYHALPDTTVFVAKHAGEVVATFTLVPDGKPLGLPLESLYEEEVEQLRKQGRRLAEVTSLAATGLSQREFMQVFVSLIKLMLQYHFHQGGDTWVITVNPRHSAFYCKVMGGVPLGPCRSYEVVKGHPAEAYWVDRHLMQSSSPKMYNQIFGESIPAELLSATGMPIGLIRHLAAQSSQLDVLDVEQILGYVARHGRTRSW